MDRLIAWYRVSSSVGAVVALILANAIPLLGVLFLGWNVWLLLIVYWLENGIVGAFNVLKILRAEGPADPTATVRIGGRPGSMAGRTGVAGFFLIHYGLFWLVHGVFVLVNDLPPVLFPLVWLVMQLGNVFAAPVLAGYALLATGRIG